MPGVTGVAPTTQEPVVLLAGDLLPVELPEVLAAWEAPAEDRTWVWFDGVDGFTLDFWPGLDGQVLWYQAGELPTNRSVAEVLPNVSSGRVFSRAGELRWRRLPGLGERCIRVVFLGSAHIGWKLPHLHPREELKGLYPQRAIYRLWGQQTVNTPGEWIDLRIPHRFRYPVQASAPKAGRLLAKLEVERWCNPAGQMEFVRLRQVLAQVED